MRKGAPLVIILILFGIIGGLVNGSAIYSRMAYLGIFLGVGAWIWSHLNWRSLRVERNSRILQASVGDVFIEHFEIIYTGRLVIPWVEVVNESPVPFASGSRLLTMVGPHQKRSYLVRTWLTKRGKYPLGPTKLTTGDPMGLFQMSNRTPARQSLIVMPMLFEIQSFQSPPGLLPGGQVIRQKAMNVTTQAASVREYIPGDPLKRIHWPTSVRREKLMVKEFDQDPQAEIWLILDAQEKVHLEKPEKSEDIQFDGIFSSRRPKFILPSSTLEYAVSICASLTHYFIQRRRSIGLLASGKTLTILPAEKGVRQERKILKTLAFVEARGNLSLAGLVSVISGQLHQGSLAIIITPAVGGDLQLAAGSLQYRNLNPVVILLAAESFGGARGAGTLAQSLRSHRIPVCLVACGDNLSRVISGFSSQVISRDLHEWQRPTLSHLT